MRDACSLLGFDLAACVQQMVGGWMAAIPFDWLVWAAFFAGLVLGSILGWKRLLAVGLALALFKLFSGRKAAPADEIYPHPDEQRRKRLELPDLFGRLGRGRSGSSDMGDWIEGDS